MLEKLFLTQSYRYIIYGNNAMKGELYMSTFCSFTQSSSVLYSIWHPPYMDIMLSLCPYHMPVRKTQVLQASPEIQYSPENHRILVPYIWHFVFQKCLLAGRCIAWWWLRWSCREIFIIGKSAVQVYVRTRSEGCWRGKVTDRLDLSVRSVEINGRILPLQLVAYDTDGIAGIYCP